MIDQPSAWRLTADWVLPIDAPPIRFGAVLVGPGGRIEAVGAAAEVPSPPGRPSHDYPAAVLLPGLVNAHTHLELTGLAGRVDESDFSRWIRAVRELKAGLDANDFSAAARQGIRDAFAAGITYVFDTGDSGAAFGALTELGGAGTVYQEVFGPHPDQAPASFAELTARVERARGEVGPRVTVGSSPHAPYTVSSPLYARVGRWAVEGGVPLAVHLAESGAETEFVTKGEGPFAEAWRGRGIPPLPAQRPNDPAARRSPVAWLDAHGILGPATLAIHAVRLDRRDIELLARRNVAIAHCPISNCNHCHGAAPLAALRRAGVRVGLGTDSVISVGRLDLFAEMRAARALGHLSASETVALATRDGARLVTERADFGTLTPGHWADLTVVALPEGGGSVPEEGVVAASPAAVLATYASGRLVHRRGGAA